jgi:hypothetical protein
VQFIGTCPSYRVTTIWTARAEPHCRFFAWLAIQGKAPTADNMLKRSWPCDPECTLCFCMLETNEHLLTECNFAEAVWDKVVLDLRVHQSLIHFNKGTSSEWLEAAGRAGSRKNQKESAGAIFLFRWHIWKERNARIFQHRSNKAAATELNQVFPLS